MHVTVVSGPSPVVSLEEARRQIVDLPEEDESFVEGLVAGATGWIDGPGRWLGRSIGVQTLEYSNDRFCDQLIDLPYGPVIDIISVSYIDEHGQSMTMPADQYEYVDELLGPVYGGDWPSARVQRGAVRIRYRAGYGKLNGAEPPVLVNDCPPAIKVAILMLVAQWYQTREPIAIGSTVETLPNGVDALLQPFRVFR